MGTCGCSGFGDTKGEGLGKTSSNVIGNCVWPLPPPWSAINFTLSCLLLMKLDKRQQMMTCVDGSWATASGVSLCI